MSSGLLPRDDDWSHDEHGDDGDDHDEDGGDDDENDDDDHEEEKEAIVGVDGKSDCHNSTNPPVCQVGPHQMMMVSRIVVIVWRWSN